MDPLNASLCAPAAKGNKSKISKYCGVISAVQWSSCKGSRNTSTKGEEESGGKGGEPFFLSRGARVRVTVGYHVEQTHAHQFSQRPLLPPPVHDYLTAVSAHAPSSTCVFHTERCSVLGKPASSPQCAAHLWSNPCQYAPCRENAPWRAHYSTLQELPHGPRPGHTLG